MAAATELNKIDFGESNRPDIDDDWCYVSSENVQEKVVHVTTLVIHLITNVYSLEINLLKSLFLRVVLFSNSQKLS